MKTLNNYQMELIQKAMKEEAEKDVRLNKGMPRETTNLFHSWLKDEDEIAYSALIKTLDFWGCYFAAGAEVAFKIRDEEHKKLLEELNKKSQAAIRKMEREIAEIIAKREAAANGNE